MPPLATSAGRALRPFVTPRSAAPWGVFMPKEMVISANPHETRVAILEEGQLCEYYVEREKEFALVGSIYKGRVTRVLPGMQSAFVEIGLDSDAFLYVSDFLEGVEEFEPIVTTVEEKTQKMQEEGGQVFPSNGGAPPVIEPPDVEALPGESIAAHGEPAPGTDQASSESEEPQPGNTWAAPQAPSSPRQEYGSHDRDRYESRRHGRDFGRRGGGRRGRFGRRGGGRGGDRRYGRELPPSKYASAHDRAEESGPGEPYVPVILPGESLARYKVPGTVAPGAPTEEMAPNVSPGEPLAIPGSAAPQETGEAAPSAAGESAVSESRVELRYGSYERAGESVPRPERHERYERRDRRERYPRPERHERFAPSSSTATSGSSFVLEPLPGESISKWRDAAPAQPESAGESVHEERGESGAPAVEEHEHERTPAEHEEPKGFAASHDEGPELTADEAATVAEHVAEAQSEQAEREQLRDDISAAGDAGEIEAPEDEVRGEESGEDLGTGEENGYDAEDDEGASAEERQEAEEAAEEIAAAQAGIGAPALRRERSRRFPAAHAASRAPRARRARSRPPSESPVPRPSSPAESASPIDRGPAQAGPGNHRADRQGATG